MKLGYLGWIAAVGLAGLGAIMGFQGSTNKIGVVDMLGVFTKSDFAKSQTLVLQQFAEARGAMLEFVQTYPTFTPEQASRFHDLSVKATPTAAEKAELEKIKADVKKAADRLKELQTKTNPTQTESAEMAELSRRVQTTTDTAKRWGNDATDEVSNLKDKLQKDTLEKVRAAVKQVGAAQGYTVVFDSAFAPYGANDVTDEALKAMNKK